MILNQFVVLELTLFEFFSGKMMEKKNILIIIINFSTSRMFALLKFTFYFLKKVCSVHFLCIQFIKVFVKNMFSFSLYDKVLKNYIFNN